MRHHLVKARRAEYVDSLGRKWRWDDVAKKYRYVRKGDDGRASQPTTSAPTKTKSQTVAAKQRAAQIVDLLKQKKTTAEIAAVLGLSVARVQQLVSAIRDEQYRTQFAYKVQQYDRASAAVKQIADYTGVLPIGAEVEQYMKDNLSSIFAPKKTTSAIVAHDSQPLGLRNDSVFHQDPVMADRAIDYLDDVLTNLRDLSKWKLVVEAFRNGGSAELPTEAQRQSTIEHVTELRNGILQAKSLPQTVAAVMQYDAAASQFDLVRSLPDIIMYELAGGMNGGQRLGVSDQLDRLLDDNGNDTPLSLWVRQTTTTGDLADAKWLTQNDDYDAVRRHARLLLQLSLMPQYDGLVRFLLDGYTTTDISGGEGPLVGGMMNTNVASPLLYARYKAAADWLRQTRPELVAVLQKHTEVAPQAAQLAAYLNKLSAAHATSSKLSADELKQLSAALYRGLISADKPELLKYAQRHQLPDPDTWLTSDAFKRLITTDDAQHPYFWMNPPSSAYYQSQMLAVGLSPHNTESPFSFTGTHSAAVAEPSMDAADVIEATKIPAAMRTTYTAKQLHDDLLPVVQSPIGQALLSRIQRGAKAIVGGDEEAYRTLSVGELYGHYVQRQLAQARALSHVSPDGVVQWSVYRPRLDRESAVATAQGTVGYRSGDLRDLLRQPSDDHRSYLSFVADVGNAMRMSRGTVSASAAVDRELQVRPPSTLAGSWTARPSDKARSTVSQYLVAPDDSVGFKALVSRIAATATKVTHQLSGAIQSSASAIGDSVERAVALNVAANYQMTRHQQRSAKVWHRLPLTQAATYALTSKLSGKLEAAVQELRSRAAAGRARKKRSSKYPNVVLSDVSADERQKITEKILNADWDKTTHGGFTVDVKHVFRVSNSSLLPQMEEAQQARGNIRTLYHGTHFAAGAGIIRDGFKVPKKVKTGRSLGNGTYFADKSSKSAQYLGLSMGRHGQRGVLLVSKVALGNSIVRANGNYSTPTDPTRNADSVVDPGQNAGGHFINWEACVFNPGVAATPLYWVELESK